MAALVAAIECFDTENSQNHLRFNTVHFLGSGQRVGVLVPERHALLHPSISDEDLAVLVPRPNPLGRPGDSLKNSVLALGLCQQSAYMLGVEAVLAAHLLDKGVNRRMFRSIGSSGEQRGTEPGGQQRSQCIVA